MEENIFTDPMTAFPVFAPGRVVSLVPSVTSSLFDLGLGSTLVGVSDFCSDPPESVAQLPKLGGPKNPDLEAILSLQPEIVICNREENSRAGVEALARAGMVVWLTFPTNVRTALDELLMMARLFRSEPAMDRARLLEQSVEWAELAAVEPPTMRYFCPIWEDHLDDGKRWWMTFNDRTYSSDVLRLFGGVNVFAERERRYPLLADLGLTEAENPGERDTRYPRVTWEEILAAQPELVLLPSEPYNYQEKDGGAWLELLAETPAGKAARIYTIDGSLITWPGTRLARALEELPQVFTT